MMELLLAIYLLVVCILFVVWFFCLASSLYDYLDVLKRSKSTGEDRFYADQLQRSSREVLKTFFGGSLLLS